MAKVLDITMQAISLQQIEALNANNANISDNIDELDDNTKGLSQNQSNINKNTTGLNQTVARLNANSSKISLNNAGLKTNSSSLMNNSSVINQLIKSNRRLDAQLFSMNASTKLNINALKLLGHHLGGFDLSFKVAMDGLANTVTNLVAPAAASIAGGKGRAGGNSGVNKMNTKIASMQKMLADMGSGQAGPVTKMLQKYAAPNQMGVKAGAGGVGAKTDPMSIFFPSGPPKLPTAKASKAMGGMFKGLGKMGPKMLALGIGLKIASGVFAPFGMFMDTFGAFGEILGTAFLPVLIPINNQLIKAIPYLIKFVEWTGKMGEMAKLMGQVMGSIGGQMAEQYNKLKNTLSTKWSTEWKDGWNDFIQAKWLINGLQSFSDTVIGWFASVLTSILNGVSDLIYEKTGVRL